MACKTDREIGHVNCSALGYKFKLAWHVIVVYRCTDKKAMYWILLFVLCRIYDCQLEIIQVSRGHNDNIREIVHIPELDQVSLF